MNWRADYDLLLNLAQLPRLSLRRKFLKLRLLFNIFRLLIMILPHLLGGYHPILTDSRTLYNSPLYMPELTTSNILFFHHLLKPGTPYTSMLPARILCCPLNVPYIMFCCKVARLTLAFIYIAISTDLC